MRERRKEKGKSKIIFSILAILLLLFSFNNAFAETEVKKSTFTLEVKDNLINLEATQASFKEILKELEKKAGIKINISEGVADQKVAVDIKSLPVYALSTLLEKMSLRNFAVFYDKVLTAFILPEGKDISEFLKGKSVIRPAAFPNWKDVSRVKGREIVSTIRGKNKVPILYVKDEVLLKFHLGVTKEEIEDILKKHNLDLIAGGKLSKIGYVKVRIPDGRDVMTVIKEIRKEYKLKVPEPNYISNVLTVSDPLYNDQWYVSDINFDKAWEEADSKSPIKVAVIDSGIDTKHPDLKGKILNGYDFLNDDADPSDDHGHGTFVAGIIAATSNDIGIKGLYDYTQIIPIKVIDENGVGTYEDTARGIIYAVDNGAKVINLSIGGYAYSFMLQDAVDYALEKGCIVVAAAGNDGIEQPIYPAAYPDVIGVSALGYNGQIWSSSNTGRHIDVSAPGVNILSTGSSSDYVYATGTSASTPMVSSLAAMLVSEKTELSSSVIERLIMQSAKDLGDEGRDKVYGSGEIDALASLEQEVEPFHDVAVRSVSVEPMVFEKGKPTYIVANIENTGTYKSEEFDVVLYEIIGEGKKEIGKKKALTVIDKLKVIFDWEPESLKENIKFEVAVFSVDDTNSSNNSKTTFSFSIKEENGLYVLYKVKPPVHQWIAFQAFKKVESDDPSSPLVNEIKKYIPTDSNSNYYSKDFVVPYGWSDNSDLPYIFYDALIEGVWEEDNDDYGISDTWYNDAYCRHFWTPEVGGEYDYNRGFLAANILEAGFCGNSWINWDRNDSGRMQAQRWWDLALQAYPNDKTLAYYYLGRVVHLLEDLSVPEHSHGDSHEALLWGTGNPSPYEEYTKDNYKNITAGDSNTDIPNIDSIQAYPAYTPSNFDDGLTKLFYNLAEYADDFDGNDTNGESSEFGHGKFRYARNQLDAGKSVSKVELWDSTILGNPNYRIRDMNRYVDYDYYNNSCENRIYYYESFYNAINNTDDGVRVYYTDGTDDYFYNLDEPNLLSWSNESQECIYQPNLQARATGYVAALYQLFWAKTHPPTVNALSVTPNSLPLGNYFTISYSVSDVSGSGLKQVELWRATDTNGDGEPDWPSSPIQDPTILSGQSNYSGFFYDEPRSEDTYWYGIHVVDNAGNWNDERNSQTGGLPGDYSQIPVTVNSVIILPTVISHNYGTSPNTNIYVTFSKDMDDTTFTSSTISVSGSSSGSYSNSFSFNHSTYELTIDPLTNFSYSETVTVTIGTGVKDLAGNGLASPYTFSFTIESSPPPPPTSISVTASANPSTTTAYAPITVSGTATYDTKALVSSGTATITVEGNEWTAPILNNGSFSQEVNAPGSSQNITVSASDGILTGSATVYVTISGDTPPNNYDLTTDIVVDAWDDGSTVYRTAKPSFRTTDYAVYGFMLMEPKSGSDFSLNNWVYSRYRFYSPDGRDRKSTRLNSSHIPLSRMPSSA